MKLNRPALLGIRPDAYNFVPERSFLEPRLSGYYVPAARNVTIIHNTTDITNYTCIDNRVVNRGPELSAARRLEARSAVEGLDGVTKVVSVDKS